MNQLAEELKEIVGNYTDNFTILKNKDEVRLFINEITSPLMYDILVVSKSLNYGFIIKNEFYINRLDLNIKIEFYKTL
jgi:hypothetical protein